MTSPFSKFYNKSPQERRSTVAKERGLSAKEEAALSDFGALGEETANRLIENVVGSYTMPLGVATNFLVNGKEVLVPMAVEESSVVAAASNGAKMARQGGGFKVESTECIAIGQVHLLCEEPEKAAAKVKEAEKGLVERANTLDPVLVEHGGGARGIETRVLKTEAGGALVVHLLVDTRDAMGANAVNSMCEGIAPKLEELSGGKARLKILSNLAVHRTATARAVFDKETLGGERVVDAIVEAWQLGEADAFRAATMNKGIMNGVDAVVLATGNDWRAIEAGAHAYASISGGYKPLAHYHKNKAGDLEGMLTLPVAVGTVGGATKSHPTAQAALKVLGVQRARELGEVLAAVGLAQNLAALRALSAEGIQKGHMKLHAHNIALQAGAANDEVEEIAQEMVAQGKVREDLARDLIAERRKTK